MLLTAAEWLLHQAGGFAVALRLATQAAGYYTNLALAGHALGDLDAATRLLQEALTVFRERNDSYHIIQTLTKLGVLQLDCAEFTAAHSSFSEALELARKTALDGEVPRLLVNLANIDYDQQAYTAARKKLQTAHRTDSAGTDCRCSRPACSSRAV